MHFFFNLNFNFWGTFGVFVKIFRLVFVKLISYNHALHSMLILTMCSCILGLCACLNNVRAIRLDWVSTHDAFYLCTTHVHALHVLIPSFLHLNVFVVFLFFSLSLLFGLLIMVSKKFVPSKNQIRHGSSSSSFPPNSIRFRDEKARADFSKNFSDRAIHSEP